MMKIENWRVFYCNGRKSRYMRREGKSPCGGGRRPSPAALISGQFSSRRRLQLLNTAAE
jgi:hypothetical protein